MKLSFQAKLLALAVLSFLFQSSIYGQATAGYVPSGTSVNFTPVELRMIENETDTSAYLDFDGDGFDDVRVWLIKGNPPSDASNMVLFWTFGNKFSFCTDEDSPENVVLYNLGDTLCSIGSVWGTDSIYIAGCYAGWNCSHDTSSVQDKYVAYKKNSTGEVGWIKVSMSLYSQADQIPVTFTISEMLVLFLGSAINDAKELFSFDVAPNPTLDGHFGIKSTSHFRNIEIYNSSGQCIITYNGTEEEYILPDVKGVYIIRTIDREGTSSIRKILRL